MNYLTGFMVPVLLALTGLFGKKLVRGTGWQPNDFFLGIELTLGSMTSGLLHLFDLFKAMNAQAVVPKPLVTNLIGTGIFIVVTFFLFLYVLTLHQDWEHQDNGPAKTMRLGYACNSIGFFLMIAFLLWVKGID